MSRVSVQGIVGYSSPSDWALVRDAGGQPRCDPAKIPKEIACLLTNTKYCPAQPRAMGCGLFWGLTPVATHAHANVPYHRRWFH